MDIEFKHGVCVTSSSMVEINVLYCAHAGCRGNQNCAPAVCACDLPYIKVLYVRKGMHTPGAQVLKSVHPAAKMCTQGAGCTLLLYGALIKKIEIT